MMIKAIIITRELYDEKPEDALEDDDCFYYHSWRNNVLIACGTLSSFLT